MYKYSVHSLKFVQYKSELAPLETWRTQMNKGIYGASAGWFLELGLGVIVFVLSVLPCPNIKKENLYGNLSRFYFDVTTIGIEIHINLGFSRRVYLNSSSWFKSKGTRLLEGLGIRTYLVRVLALHSLFSSLSLRSSVSLSLFLRLWVWGMEW